MSYCRTLELFHCFTLINHALRAMLCDTQGSAEAAPAGVWWAGYVNVSHKMGSNLVISPKMSDDVLECDIVMLQNYMLMIL